jgi:hypothetical protein
MIKLSRFSRRALLKGASATALLPLLEADIARADCIPAGRKRLIVMHWNNGVLENVANDLTLPGSMSALTPHKADLLVPLGLHNKAYEDSWDRAASGQPGHGHPRAMLIAQRMPAAPPGACGVASAPTESMDYLIGHKLQQDIASPYPVINLGVLFSNYCSGTAAWEAPGVPAYPSDDPYQVFDQLFSGTQMPQTDTAVEQRRIVRKSVLDYVQKDIARFARKLGTADRQKVDGHLSAIRDIEQRLTPPMTSGQCTVPTLGPMYDVHNEDNYDKVLTAQIDIGVAALAAGLSQVLTLHASSGTGSHYCPTWLGYSGPDGYITDAGDEACHHAIAHADDAVKLVIDTWFYQKVAYLIAKLKSVPEGGGTMFDNTVVLVTNPMDSGNHHEISNLPWLLAGSAGGFFKTGQALQTNDASHTGLLIGLCNAFGVSPTGWADPNYGGELAGLRA